jgi:hypothetical protein
MTHQTATDHGTVVQADQAALIVDPDGSFRLLLPNVPADPDASFGHALITAMAVKLNDPEWVEDLLAALEAASNAEKVH